MLEAFFQELARRPFVWGQTDCALVLGEWWQMNHGVDPAAHLRGTYSTEEECRAVIDSHGGGSLLKLISNLAESVEAQPTMDFKPGDFAVVGVKSVRFGAIRTGTGRWFVKALHGAAAVRDARVISAWSI